MIVSVIVPDSTIIIDGDPKTFAFSAMPGLRAIQWNGTNGTLEFETGPNQWFDNAAIVQPYLDAYNAEAARLAAEASTPV